MNLRQHNSAELADIQDLIDRETHLLGERIKRDPRASMDDMTAVMERVSEVILEGGFGEYLDKKVEGISNDNV